jgi:purine-binding chemotaxis protein CheW
MAEQVENAKIGSFKQSTSKQYICFILGETEFNAPISLIQEIVEMPVITLVPNVPPYVEGVMNLRGRVIPVIDLKKRLGLGERTNSSDSRIIVFRIKDRTVGFIVNAITQVLELSDEQIEPPSDLLLSSNEGKFVIGISKLENRLPLLLDIPKILENSKSQYAEKKKPMQAAEEKP